jgi:hypothetical protein
MIKRKSYLKVRHKIVNWNYFNHAFMQIRINRYFKRYFIILYLNTLFDYKNISYIHNITNMLAHYFT